MADVAISASSAATKSAIRSLTIGAGEILVQGATATTQYSCNADSAYTGGGTDDRATILSALTAAAADMPCKVTIGPGFYRITSGVSVNPVQGERGLEIQGSDGTVFVIDNASAQMPVGNSVMINIKPSVLTGIKDVYASYLKDIHVHNIGFVDTDPVVHAGSGEESHAIQISYAVNASIVHCTADSIGDEGFNLAHVVQGSVNDCVLQNTPSVSAGNAINFSAGCRSVQAIGNKCHGSATLGTKSTIVGSGGIGIEVISDTETPAVVTSDNILIQNNIIRDFDIGTNYNTAADDCKNVSIQDNLYDNCDLGIQFAGGGNLHSFTIIKGNTIKDGEYGIDMNVLQTSNEDTVVSFNVIDNMSTRGMRLNGDRLSLSGNNISNVPGEAIFINDCTDVQVSGGTIDTCGTTAVATIRAAADGFEVDVEGVKILNSASTTQCVLNCERVRNCKIHQTAPHYQQIFSCAEATNNSCNGGIQLDSAVIRGVISANRIDCGGSDPGGTMITIASTNNNASVTGNTVNTVNGTPRVGITIGGTAASCVIDGNVVTSDGGSGGITGTGSPAFVGTNQDV